jgi:pyruvate dehydrogenase E2 component (dihydrolipoamide acetyltransferase)
MATEVVVPEVGEVGMEVTFVRWLREVGDNVKEGDALFELDTLKSIVEVEAYANGRLAAVVVSVGDLVQPHQVLALLLAPGETAPLPGPRSTVAPVSKPRANAPAQAAPDSAGAPRAGRPPVSPRARRVAAELAVDLDMVAGTGPDGLVTERNVRDAAAQALAPERDVPTSRVADEVARVERIREGVAARTTLAWRTIPHYHLRLEADVTEALQGGGPTAAFCIAAARALARHPECNLGWAGERVVRRDSVDLGLLVDTPGGLLIARIADADRLSRVEMGEAVAAAAVRAREGKLQPSDGGPRSVTISNLGMHAVDSFSGVIATPDVLLLTSGRIRFAPRWDGEAFRTRRVVDLTLSVDHRALDGAAAGRYLTTLEAILADPREFA